MDSADSKKLSHIYIKVLTRASTQSSGLYENYMSIETLEKRYKYKSKKPNAYQDWGRLTLSAQDSAIYGDYIVFASGARDTVIKKSHVRIWWIGSSNIIIAKMSGLTFIDINLTDPYFGIIASKVAPGILGKINDPKITPPDGDGPIEPIAAAADDDQRE